MPDGSVFIARIEFTNHLPRTEESFTSHPLNCITPWNSHPSSTSSPLFIDYVPLYDSDLQIFRILMHLFHPFNSLPLWSSTSRCPTASSQDPTSFYSLASQRSCEFLCESSSCLRQTCKYTSFLVCLQVWLRKHLKGNSMLRASSPIHRE